VLKNLAYYAQTQNQDYAQDMTVLLEYIRIKVTALLEYLDLTFVKCKKIRCMIICSNKCVAIMFILLQYFSTRIVHLIKILENRPTMLA